MTLATIPRTTNSQLTRSRVAGLAKLAGVGVAKGVGSGLLGAVVAPFDMDMVWRPALAGSRYFKWMRPGGNLPADPNPIPLLGTGFINDLPG